MAAVGIEGRSPEFDKFVDERMRWLIPAEVREID